MTSSIAVVVFLLSAGTTGATESQSASQVAAPRDFQSPPPGASPADQELWRRARHVDNQILIERGISTRLQARARGNAYGERLTTLANEGALPANRADDLKTRLYATWGESATLLTQQWPVDPTRSCRAPLLVFEGVLFREDSAGKTAQLDDTRRILRSCVDRGTMPLEALAKLNVQFEALLDEIERTIGDARREKPPTAASPVPAAVSTPR
jgi:hypothetical protein